MHPERRRRPANPVVANPYTEIVKAHVGVLLLVALAAGCASTKESYMFLTPERWSQEMARRGIDLKEVPNPLGISADIQTTAENLAGLGSDRERLERLQVALFTPRSFPFRYDHHETLTATEAFARREGNCLSFTNLFVAMGRALGLPVTTALVRRALASEKEGDLVIVNNHVVAVLRSGTEWVYYDFDQHSNERPTLVQPIDDLWITALYLNNRGADELRAGRADVALHLFDYATKLAPAFPPTWGNMGVARRRLGNIQGAFDAYSQALKVSADDPTILGNLASLYRSLGKEQEAREVLHALRIGNATPNVLIVRGDLDLNAGRVSKAMRLYERARRLGPKLADPWVALARAELARSRPDRARSDVVRALRLEPANSDALELLHRLDAGPARSSPD
jgi:Flp pilus assembly protein TadD